jgi:hypothetical protein
MPERWLQIKGDASVRAQLFEQLRTQSLFDDAIDRLHEIALGLLTRKGVFHLKIHYSSSQITCWFSRDPFCYEKYVGEAVFDKDFLERFPDADFAGRTPLLGAPEIRCLITEFKRLRMTDQTVYLRNAAVNLINGMINMSFSCDGTHYLDYKTFLAKLDNFETPG